MHPHMVNERTLMFCCDATSSATCVPSSILVDLYVILSKYILYSRFIASKFCPARCIVSMLYTVNISHLAILIVH